MPRIDAVAARLVADSFGRARDEELVARGVAARSIRRRIARGEWSRDAPGVVGIVPMADSLERRIHLAEIAGPRGTVASHWTAARLLGVDVAGARPIEVTVPRDRRHPLGWPLVHTAVGDLPSVSVGPHVVTAPSRTARDLAVVASQAELSRVVRSLLRLGRTDHGALLAAAARGLPGARRLRTAVQRDLALGLTTESPVEDVLVPLLAAAGLPRFETQHRTVLSTGRRVRFDVAWPAPLVALEIDGASWHDDAAAVQRDAGRSADAVLDGWVVERCRLTDAAPARMRGIVRRLGALLASR